MLELFEYELPFRSPFRTGSSVYKNRKGILLHYKQDAIDLVTEASPLPGFSDETHAGVKQILSGQKEFIENFLDSRFSLQEVRNLQLHKDLAAPSIQFALSFLGLAVLAERKGKTVYDLLNVIPAESIRVNDVIGHAPLDEMEKQIEESVQKGFGVIKIKAVHPVKKLASLLSEVQKKYPALQFRLDANQSWPYASVQKNCELFRDLSLQYIEEPAPFENIHKIQYLQKKCTVPIALDESVSTIKRLKNVLEEQPETFVIIKPMLMGNILEIHETISRFRSSFTHIVCTTALESSIGRSMVATTASLIGDQTISHGLNTGHLFASDLLPDYKVENGLLKNLQNYPGTKSFRNVKTSYLKKLE